MASRKLKNAPLKEVIFELLWRVPPDHRGVHVDRGFDLAVGKFHHGIAKEFPITRRVVPPGVNIYPKPVFQFWKGAAIFPVVQLGPGILSVNDTDKNYTWEDFRSNVTKAIDLLINSYGSTLSFNICRLQYMDAVDLNIPDEGIEDYIAKNHLTSIKSEYKLPGKFKNLSIVQTRELEDASTLNVNITTARNNLKKVRSVIWKTQIERKGNTTSDSVISWLDNSHNNASKVFVMMLNQEYYEHFDN
jgi:uncharacterized protein (TIGR04255 family)